MSIFTPLNNNEYLIAKESATSNLKSRGLFISHQKSFRDYKSIPSSSPRMEMIQSARAMHVEEDASRYLKAELGIDLTSIQRCNILRIPQCLISNSTKI